MKRSSRAQARRAAVEGPTELIRRREPDDRKQKTRAAVPDALVCYEATAQIYYFHRKLNAAVETQQLEDITNHVTRGAFGSKDGSTELEAIQVLTAIDHLNREFRFVKGEYDRLCEYAHPNMKGGLGTYANMEIPAYSVQPPHGRSSCPSYRTDSSHMTE